MSFDVIKFVMNKFTKILSQIIARYNNYYFY